MNDDCRSCQGRGSKPVYSNVNPTQIINWTTCPACKGTGAD